MKVEKTERGIQAGMVGDMEALTVFEQRSNILKNELNDWCGNAM